MLFRSARLRVWRVAGVTIWHERSARERNAVERSARASGQFVTRASEEDGVHAQREGHREPAVLGHGKGRRRATVGAGGLTVLRKGWRPVRGETKGHVPVWPGGSTRCATARPRAAVDAADAWILMADCEDMEPSCARDRSGVQSAEGTGSRQV